MVSDLLATHLAGQLSRFYDTFNSLFQSLLNNFVAQPFEKKQSWEKVTQKPISRLIWFVILGFCWETPVYFSFQPFLFSLDGWPHIENNWEQNPFF